jgi:broad specificity phosphatase PhoE
LSPRAIAMPTRAVARPGGTPPSESRASVASAAPTIYWIRHGDTVLNSTHEADPEEKQPPLMRGWSRAPLTDDGRAQMDMAAGKLASKGIKKLYASDLQPTMDSAAIVGDKLGLKPIAAPELRTWDVGKLTRTPTDEARPILEEYQTKKPNAPIPGNPEFRGESFNRYIGRLTQGVQNMQSAAKKYGSIAVVTHGHPLRSLKRVMDGKSSVPMEGVAEHGDVIPMTMKEGKWSIGEAL